MPSPLKWTKDKVVKEIVNPFLYEGKTMTGLSKELGMHRTRLYALLRRYGFKNLSKQRKKVSVNEQ